MSRIADTKGREDENSGYVRLFGHSALGHLISRVHATVIRSGNELEKLLEQATAATLKIDLPDALARTKDENPTGIRVVFSPKIKKAASGHGITGDIVAVDYDNKTIRVIEVKDGDTFDTKKASGELESLKATADNLAKRTGYTAHIYFCSFNQASKETIAVGAKGRFSTQQVMTGRELCGILGIDYDDFVASRRREQATNLDYFLRQLAGMTDVAARLKELLK